MAKLTFNTSEPKAAQVKGGSYIRLIGDQQAAFRNLMRDLGFDPESPRADAGVKKVGEMVAGLGIDLARELLATGTESLAQYKEKLQAGDQAQDEAPAPAEPEAEPKADRKAEPKK
jgi:hypothetical protein